MAAVTVVDAEYITPVGYEHNDDGVYAEDVTHGQQLMISGETAAGVKQWSKCATTETEGQGIAILDAKAGRPANVMVRGEMSGLSGLTPGAPLYPSSTVAGGLDTTKPSGATIRVRAIGTDKIRVNYV